MNRFSPAPKDFYLLVVICAFFSNCTCDGASNNAPDGGLPDLTSDATDMTSEPDSSVPDDRALIERIPLSDGVGNRVEDPNFTLQSGGWFIRDRNNQVERVQRVYEWNAPESRPFISILPSSNSPVCAIGRIKFGTGEHQLRLSVASATRDLSVSVFAVSGDDYVRQDIPVMGETSEINDRTWTTIESFVGPYYGWGFLQICSTSDEAVFVGAPSVRELAATITNGLRLIPKAAITVRERARLRSLPLSRPQREEPRSGALQ